MSRRGYASEYKCKKELEKNYGVGNVIKIAIGGSSDYIVASRGRLVKVVEVKETIKKKFYPQPREKKQFELIVKFAKQHSILAELWIYYKKGSGTLGNIVKMNLQDKSQILERIDKSVSGS